MVSREDSRTYRSPIDSPRPQAEPDDVPQQEGELADGVHLQQSGLRHLQADVREEREPERQRRDPPERPAQSAAGAEDYLRVQQELRVLARGMEVVHGDARPEAANQRDHPRARCGRSSRGARGSGPLLTVWRVFSSHITHPTRDSGERLRSHSKLSNGECTSGSLIFRPARESRVENRWLSCPKRKHSSEIGASSRRTRRAALPGASRAFRPTEPSAPRPVDRWSTRSRRSRRTDRPRFRASAAMASVSASMSSVAGVATPRLTALPARGVRVVALAPRAGARFRATLKVRRAFPSVLPTRGDLAAVAATRAIVTQ